MAGILCQGLSALGLYPGFCVPQKPLNSLKLVGCSTSADYFSTAEVREKECCDGCFGGWGGSGGGGGGTGEDAVAASETYTPVDLYSPPKDVYVPPADKGAECQLKWVRGVAPGAVPPIVDLKSGIRGDLLSEPIIADIDGDGKKEIIVRSSPANQNDRVFVYNADGELAAGWPQDIVAEGESFHSIGTRSSCAVGGISGGSKQEIVCSGANNEHYIISAFDDKGKIVGGWPIIIDEPPTVVKRGEAAMAVSLGNLTKNQSLDNLEIVGKTLSSKMIFSFDGQLVNSFPLDLNISQREMALGDIDGDGYDEICDFGKSDTVSCIKADSKSSLSVEVYPFMAGTTVSLADLNQDGKLEVIIRYPATGKETQDIAILNSSGLVQATIHVPGKFSALAAGSIGRLGLDQPLPSIIHTEYAREASEFGEGLWSLTNLYAYSLGSSGEKFKTFVKPEDELEKKGGVFLSDQQAIADIDGDGRQEILAACYQNCSSLVLRVYGSDGKLEQLLSRESQNRSYWNAPAVGDLDGGGKAKVVVSGYEEKVGGQLLLYECQGQINPALMSWPMRRHDARGSVNHEGGK